MKKDDLKKLRPLVQLVPAAAVVALVMATLPHSRPVLAEVPAQLAAPVEQSEETRPETPEAGRTELLPSMPTASIPARRRAMAVRSPCRSPWKAAASRTFRFSERLPRDGLFLQSSQDTGGDGAEAAELGGGRGVRRATYSSKGILGAIQNALTGEQVKTEAPEKAEPAPLVSESFSVPAAYRDGVYTGSAQGFGGLITVQVTISGGVITDVAVLSAAGETPSDFSRAQAVLSAVVSAGSPNVDTVSGATYSSSNGILNASQACARSGGVGRCGAARG